MTLSECSTPMRLYSDPVFEGTILMRTPQTTTSSKELLVLFNEEPRFTINRTLN